MLLGGLAAALVLNLASHGRSPAAALRLNASAALARTSAGRDDLRHQPGGAAAVVRASPLRTRPLHQQHPDRIWWIAVIFLLIGCYWHIYRFTAKLQEGRRAWPMALISLALALVMSRIYSTNMTLMLHPETWQRLYAASAIGAQLPAADPALLPRWLFMLTGGVAVGGLWMIWLAGRESIEPEIRTYLSATGGWMAVVALPVQILTAFQVISAQPGLIRQSLPSDVYFRPAALVWLAGAGLLGLLAAWCAAARPTSRLPGWTAVALGLVAMLGMVTCRDVLRDITLLSHGFNVWDRAVATNWPVISFFLICFVAGLVCMAWLISVSLRAKPVAERPL